MACGAGVILLVGMGMAWASGDERLTYSVALSLGVTVIFSGIIGAAVDRVIRAVDRNAITMESVNSRLGWVVVHVAKQRVGGAVQRPGKIPDTGEIPPEIYAKAFVDLVHQQQRADGQPTALHSVRPPWRNGQTR